MHLPVFRETVGLVHGCVLPAHRGNDIRLLGPTRLAGAMNRANSGQSKAARCGLHPYGIKHAARRRTGGLWRTAPIGSSLAAPVGLPILRGMHRLGGQVHYSVPDAYCRLLPSQLEQCHRPGDAILLRAAAHPVGVPIAMHPTQGRSMLGMARLPQPYDHHTQEE